MRKKGILKKFLGVLCIGALISMPVTANAADKSDVVGEWRTNSMIFTFYDNGDADHVYYDGQQWQKNTRDYHMQSGTLEITYRSSGNKETISYDFWRGEKIDNVPDSEYADAVVFKIIDSGKIQFWNVSKETNQSDWKAFDPAIMTRKVDTGFSSSTGADSIVPARKCEHSYEWVATAEPTETADGVISFMCTSCGDVKERQPISAYVAIRKNLLDSIKNAEAGATVTFDNKAWLCYPQYVLDALKEKGDVSLKTDFTYEGVNYSFTIPAGSDYTNLEPADFYGFMYLSGAFGGTVVE